MHTNGSEYTFVKTKNPFGYFMLQVDHKYSLFFKFVIDSIIVLLNKLSLKDLNQNGLFFSFRKF